MTATVAELLEVLTLDRIEDDLFRGCSPRTSLQRVFGGQVLGQALMAAGATVTPARHVNSLHAYFLRLGDPEVPIAYLVERVREGRSFSTRRVEARQHGRAIFHMSASFQILEPGLEHQDSAPQVPGPDDPANSAHFQARGDAARSLDPDEWAAIDVRRVAPTEPDGAAHGDLRVWLRAAGRLPDDPLLHAAVLAYASDLTLLATALVPHPLRIGSPQLFSASLDHAMWFHRPFRADEWLLHDEHSPSASNARGIGLGRVFSLDGRLVATTVQEGLMRLVDPDGAPPR
jgi:acyl-CoA thioesterase-2